MGFVKRARRLLGSLVSLLALKRRTVLLVLAVIFITLLMSSLVSMWLSSFNDVRLPNIGNIRTSGIKAYWDAALTNETKQILWGDLYMGSATNVTLYLRSISNTKITLNMTSGNWTFRDSLNEAVYGPADTVEYMNLTWNYNDSTLSPGQTIQVMFTLHAEATADFVEYVIQNDVQSFTFDVYIHPVEEN